MLLDSTNDQLANFDCIRDYLMLLFSGEKENGGFRFGTEHAVTSKKLCQ